MLTFRKKDFLILNIKRQTKRRTFQYSVDDYWNASNERKKKTNSQLQVNEDHVYTHSRKKKHILDFFFLSSLYYDEKCRFNAPTTHIHPQNFHCYSFRLCCCLILKPKFENVNVLILNEQFKCCVYAKLSYSFECYKRMNDQSLKIWFTSLLRYVSFWIIVSM